MASAETESKIAKAIDLATAMTSFYVVGVLWAPLNLVPAVGTVLDLALGLAAGLVVPVFVYGKPSAHITWKLGNETPFPGNHGLNFASQSEITCVLDVTVRGRSLAARYLLKRAARDGMVIMVRFRPHDVVRLKEQNSTGGAHVDIRNHTISLPISTPEDGAKQECRAFFSIVASPSLSGADTVQVSVEPLRTEDREKSRWLTVTSDVVDLSVRS